MAGWSKGRGERSVRIAFAILRDCEPDRDPGLYYGQLLVQRNTATWLRVLRMAGLLPVAEPGKCAGRGAVRHQVRRGAANRARGERCEPREAPSGLA